MTEVKSVKRKELRRKIEDLVSFLNETSGLSNAHTVDFVTANNWKLLHPHLRRDLSNLPSDQLNCIVGRHFSTPERRRKYPHLCNFLDRAKKFSPEQLGICKNIRDFVPEFRNYHQNNLKNANWCISEKKRHEVSHMASLISALNASFPVDLVVDVGSGKGYLSSYVAGFLGLNVLGIEACEEKCRSAAVRHAKLSEMPKTVDRTDFRKPPAPRDEAGDLPASEMPKEFVSVAERISRTSDLGEIVRRTATKRDYKKVPSSPKSFDWVSEEGCRAARSGNLSLSEMSADDKRNILLCGLHACGNLGSTLVCQFISCHSVKILCNVGCCYNLLEEEFCDPRMGADRESGFPLSATLREAKFSLGRNARMLASQCPERTIKNQDFHNSLFYRALLQVILTDYLNTSGRNWPISEFRVGRIAKNCPSFKDYVDKALKKLNLEEININCNDLENYLCKYSVEEKKLKAFQLLRIILAPCIETLILLDRLSYLWEQECVQEAYLVRLFDCLLSPRCYALVAVKKCH